ncbi:MAG: DNA replication/repair protein RecF [Bacilli bacterium]|nr:DNA replication/repair protein RecF [Bacilli bacterium]
MFYLKEISLKDFRCYRTYTEKFIPAINIIVGDNAVGKTSLVEAIYCLGLTRSHKATNDSELIREGNEYTIIKGFFNNEEEDDEIILSISNNGKRINKNNKIEASLSKYLGYFSAIIFCPEDLNLINGAPMSRRKFLDVNIGQINKQYLKYSINYKKILKQRNEVLKHLGENEKFDDRILSILTEALISEAKSIIIEREKFINELNKHLYGKCNYISSESENGKIIYTPNCSADNLKKESENKKILDKITKTTNWGPHRDDFVVTINDREASKFASQGQQKTIALSIKLGLADLIKEKSKKVLVILDDVFGELDVNRQNRVLDLLKFDNQIFITTTTIDNLSEKVLKESKVIHIDKGGEENGR